MIVYHLPIPVPAIASLLGTWILLRWRKIRFGVSFRKIYLTKGKFALVSPEDFDRLNQFKWHATSKDNRNFYASRKRYAGGKKNIQMHREIMNPPDELVVDHIDGNGLNNTRENLRLVTVAQNCYNQRKCAAKRSSKYKGVSWRKRDKKWTAVIMFQGVSINLGMFENEEEAARAYDDAAKELYREYAKLNFEGH